MRPQGPRHVRRQGMRPSYTRRPSPVRRQPRSWPQVRLLRLGGGMRLAALAIAVIAIIIVFNQLTSLKTIQVKGNHSLTGTHISDLTRQGLGQQWFGHNLALLSSDSLTSYLEHTEPGIKSATIARHLPHTLVVTIVERLPALNWKTGSSVYLLDTNATIISPTTPNYAALPTVTDSSNLPVKVGERVAPTSFVTFCTDLARLLPPTGYTIQSLTVPETTSEVYAQTTTGLLLKFDTTRPAGDEVADLQAVRTQLAAAHKAPTQYIDLRIAHKAYYK